MGGKKRQTGRNSGYYLEISDVVRRGVALVFSGTDLDRELIRCPVLAKGSFHLTNFPTLCKKQNRKGLAIPGVKSRSLRPKPQKTTTASGTSWPPREGSERYGAPTPTGSWRYETALCGCAGT